MQLIYMHRLTHQWQQAAIQGAGLPSEAFHYQCLAQGHFDI